MSHHRRTVGLLALAAGLAGSCLGLWLDAATWFLTYLAVWFAVASIPIGSLGVLLISYVVRSDWTVDLQRNFLLGALTIPLIALLCLPVLAGIPAIYPWAVAGEARAPLQAFLFIPWFFALRILLYLCILFAIACAAANAYGSRQAMIRIASIGLITWAIIVSLAGIDWIESTEPHFHSSIYGLLSISFTLLSGLSFPLALSLGASKPLRLRISAYSRLLLSVLLTWVYLHAMQYIIIWAGDIPDEVSWYLDRIAGGWIIPFWALFALQFIIPFFILLSERARGDRRVLFGICVVTLACRVQEAVILVLPPRSIWPLALLIDLPAAILIVGSAFALCWPFARGFYGRLRLNRLAAAG